MTTEEASVPSCGPRCPPKSPQPVIWIWVPQGEMAKVEPSHAPPVAAWLATSRDQLHRCELPSERDARPGGRFCRSDSACQCTLPGDKPAGAGGVPFRITVRLG